MVPVVGLLVALSLSQIVPPAAGRVSGRVTAEGSNAPVANARIMLVPARRPAGPIGIPQQAVTDSEGQFVVEGVAAGEYRVNVQKAGFVPSLDPTAPSRPFTVAAGRSVAVDVQLQKGGAISGRVLDANGEPLGEVQMMAMRRAPSSSSPRLLPPAFMQSGQQTNDLGEFRVSGLAPGEYVIAARRSMVSLFGGPNAPPPPARTARTTSATTFYPGTTDFEAAHPIVISPGAEVRDIVFSMQTVPAFSVSGAVVDENGDPVAGVMVTLMSDPRSGAFGPAGSAQTREDGRFEIGEVPAGRYVVSASMMKLGGPPGRAAVGSGPRGMVWSSGRVAINGGGPREPPIEVVVANAAVENVRVVVRRSR
jgi:protocatechuate 3,4-dioxygenase beta subunit